MVGFSLGGGDALPSEAVPSLHCGTTREDPAASIPGHVQVRYHGYLPVSAAPLFTDGFFAGSGFMNSDPAY
jgi:hypothetical protein